MDDKLFDNYGQPVRDGSRIVIEEHLIYKGHEGQEFFAMYDVLHGRWVYDRKRVTSALLDVAYTFEGVVSFRVA